MADQPGAELAGISQTESGASGTLTNVTVGTQSVAYADVQIRIETAAHERQIEKQKLDHRLQQETKDNDARRRREMTTFYVVVFGVLALLFGSFVVAATTSDPTRQTWAQGIATAVAGAIGGAFAGYAAAKR